MFTFNNLFLLPLLLRDHFLNGFQFLNNILSFFDLNILMADFVHAEIEELSFEADLIIFFLGR